jgi:DNA end-binding protein Ku
MATSVWKGHLTFGLVSLPIKLFTAARSETISFNQLHKTDHSRVKQVLYCQSEDKPVSRDELVKGYEYEKGKYVIIEEGEIEKAAPPSAQVVEVAEFVKTNEVDPVYFERSYYVSPEPAGEKAYSLLFEAMRRSGYMAIAKITMYSRETVVILRPGQRGILMHSMYYADEVRAIDEFRTDVNAVSDKELALAATVIEGLAAPFDPEKYHDTYRVNLQALIKAKVEGQAVVETARPKPLAPVVDIMEALRASLSKLDEQRKKPVASATVESASAAAAASGGSGASPKPKRGRKSGA